ncbi:MAG: hypothetical protein OEX12_15965 [Gammaproteobacteria bacterium]|nr:hypothetical protein [Gammaproteobacteria bacterium]
MTTQSHPQSIDYYKKPASLLLKDLNGPDTTRVASAMARLQLLQRSNLPDPAKVQRKHALTVVALEAGYDSWLDLKQQLQQEKRLDFSEFFASLRFGGFIHHWFLSYEEARSFQSQHGGVLLPFRKQYFVSTVDFISALAMEPTDKDWRAIGYDWLKPKSNTAMQRLQQRLAELHQS